MNRELLVILIQLTLVFAIIVIITLFLRINLAYKFEKRISKYSVRSESKELALVDKMYRRYLLFVRRQRKKIRKLFPILIQIYDKYSVGRAYKTEDFLVHKFFAGIIFIILGIISLGIQGKIITFFQTLLSFVIGFCFLDIFLILSNKINKRKIENDMLRAIIIMNNAFKSGKSTIQAVEIASKKLPKPIGYEFEKIYEEMRYGMSIDAVFNRFAKRVNIEEAEYLSSSLTILNKTGGNIVAVFDSIEKTLFDKKKLREELKNSTAVSKLVVKILLFVPIVFVGIIYLLNPTYFSPFFSSPIGFVLLIIILLMFIIYACLLDRIVKVYY